MSVQWIKVRNQSERESGHYSVPACSTPACARAVALTAACILISSIRLPQWEKHIFAIDFIRVFHETPEARRFCCGTGDRRRLSHRVGRAKPCQGCSLRLQSGADFIISIAAVQNGCCLEQFSLPGRLPEQAALPPFLSFCHFSHAGRSVRVPQPSHLAWLHVAPQDNAVTCVYIWWWPSTCFSRILPPKTKWRGASNQSSCQWIRVLPKPHPQST